MCYVDDPLAALRGTLEEIRLNAAVMILVWEALGFRLAYAKGQIGSKVTWIGGTMQCQATGILVTVKDSIIKDILMDLTEMLRTNVIAHKCLQSTVGKLNHAAGLLVILRPFMETLWAALNKPWTAHPGCVSRKQVLPALTWFHAFFTQQGAHLERFFSLSAFNRQGDKVEIGTDASPWGLGGWISLNGKVLEFFACPVTQADVDRYGHPIGSADGQQIWE